MFNRETAYLFMLHRIENGVPVFVEADILSDKMPTTVSPNTVWSRVFEMSGEDYGQARSLMIKHIHSVEWLAWARPHCPRGE
jgi:hypothetical protein